MKDTAPFTVVSANRGMASPSTASPPTPPPVSAAAGIEQLLTLCQKLLGEPDPQRLLGHFFAWAGAAGLAEGLKFEPVQEMPAIVLGSPRHHGASYRLEVNDVVSGVLTVTRRNRYPEAALAALECGLGALAPALNLAYALHQANLQATRDPLTGLLNRRALDDRLGREMAFAKREACTLSLMLIDIDHFKVINDRLGHLKGDTVLQRLARCVHGSVRKSDMTFRLGGDEFAIVLPGTGLAAAAVVARKIQDALTMLESDQSAAGSPKISIGVAEMLPEDEDKLLLQRADTHLYHAKSQGRGRICTGV